MKRLLEGLEPRRLLHAPLSALVHFQPEGTPRVHGYDTDYGYAYGLHRDGLTYGWSADATADAVNRNVSKSRKTDTFIAMQQGGDKTWSMAVENGLYQVYVFAGDPAAFNERMGITVEGQVAASGMTRKAKPYLDGTVIVNVTDGRLTLGNAAYAIGNKVDYVVIQSVESDATAKTLDLVASRPTARESGRVYGQFTVTRTGDTSKALVVPLTVGGTATNGTDYGRVGKIIAFAAGQDTATINIRPADDGVSEGDETVKLTLGRVAGYARVDASAIVTLLDHASAAAPTTVTWSTGANRPAAASEVFGTTVGDTVYTFGGYTDASYKPTKAAYAYDVSTNAWRRLADLPMALSHAGMTDDGSRYIYFAGGYPATAKAQSFSTADVYRYDTRTNTYSTLPGLPAPRGAGSLELLNGTLYFVDGADAHRQDTTTVFALDLSNPSAGWVTKAPAPASRKHVPLVTVGGALYLVGGQNDQDADTQTHADVFRYDPAANRWSTVAPLPGPRSHITDATFAYGGRIIVLGGESAYNTPVSSVLSYDPSTNKWTTLGSLPDARFSGVGGFAGGKFVYTAGYKTGFDRKTFVGTVS